jgi:hypothetical protein
VVEERCSRARTGLARGEQPIDSASPSCAGADLPTAEETLLPLTGWCCERSVVRFKDLFSDVAMNLGGVASLALEQLKSERRIASSSRMPSNP